MLHLQVPPFVAVSLLSYLSEFGQQQQQCLPNSVFDTMLQGVAIVAHLWLGYVVILEK